MVKYIVTRDVAKDAPFNHADRDVFEGELLYKFTLATYGCVDFDNGVAVSEAPGLYPFFEFPRDAVREVSDDPRAVA